MAARVLSYFAGAHTDRKIGCYDPGHCEWDEEAAAELLREWGWEAREAELREQSRLLVERHWAEIVAVAEELIVAKTRDDTEIETIADMAAGDFTAVTTCVSTAQSSYRRASE